jgi:hypothetical protein
MKCDKCGHNAYANLSFRGGGGTVPARANACCYACEYSWPLEVVPGEDATFAVLDTRSVALKGLADKRAAIVDRAAREMGELDG